MATDTAKSGSKAAAKKAPAKKTGSKKGVSKMAEDANGQGFLLDRNRRQLRL